jgi:hypothetical protein
MAEKVLTKDDLATSGELARLVGCTPKTIRDLASRGHYPRAVGTQYRFVEALQGLFSYYRTIVHDRVAHDGTAKGRCERLKGDLLDLELRKRTAKLLDSKAVESAWENIVLSFRQRLLSLPVCLASTISFCKSDAERRALLEQELGDVLMELSKAPDYKKPEQEDLPPEAKEE